MDSWESLVTSSSLAHRSQVPGPSRFLLGHGQMPGRGAGRARGAEAARYSCRCELQACYVWHPITPPTRRADPRTPALIPLVLI